MITPSIGKSVDNLRQAPAARISPANVFQLVFFFMDLL